MDNPTVKAIIQEARIQQHIFSQSKPTADLWEFFNREANAKMIVLADRIVELEQEDLDSWPCQHLHGGTPPFIYHGQTDGLCTHDECHPRNNDN